MSGQGRVVEGEGVYVITAVPCCSPESSFEIAQRWSSKIIMHISVGVSRILLCLKNLPDDKEEI